ncbi:MAG: PEP-CTERM sorting domain-containing protein [Planctomycetota bacterium]
MKKLQAFPGVFLVTAIVLLFQSHASAALYDIAITTNYGNLNQNDIPNGGQYMCGPTAVVNSLAYLQNQYPGVYSSGSLIPSQFNDLDGSGIVDVYDDMIAVAQTLAGPGYMNTKTNLPGGGTKGTWADMLIYGKHLYVEQQVSGKTIYAAQMSDIWALPGTRPIDQIPPITIPSWVQDNTDPTWNFLYNHLVGGADIEILVDWEEGGHYLTVYGFHWNDINGDQVIDQSEGAMFDYINPATGSSGTSMIWQTSAGGILKTNFATNSEITMAVSENVPEPATLLLLGLGAIILRKRKCKITSKMLNY